MPVDHRVSRSFTAQLASNYAHVAGAYSNWVKPDFFVEFGEAARAVGLAQACDGEVWMKGSGFAGKACLGAFGLQCSM